ncbi:hypothetical protein [Bradyrhizobium valentinum]|uniref:Uncharacterized protein n=1 Tax=Bradyrhizobium valentinum TaxID=1518501 RepID=A0A0R3LT04_9BRAD|nr:hypothetical protein [Bradyrhizobium valentinum]KRR08735.1 hypothetical protein CQ10_14310 [Bradyrhizobium valentinum]KRR10944.1 hypothetical protein CP49_25725 [Bradyrhizobium valentinum]
MATVWVVWDGVPRVFSSAQAATKYRDEWPRLNEGEIFEAEIDGTRLMLFQPWQLESEKTYRSIGFFMHEFSQVEYSLRYAVGEELALKPKHLDVVTAAFDVAALCNLAVVLFGERGEMKKLINRFRKLNDHRQRVAHGLWMPESEGGYVHHIARTNLKDMAYKQQAHELEKLAEEALSLRNEFSVELTGMGIYFQTEDDDHPVE